LLDSIKIHQGKRAFEFRHWRKLKTIPHFKYGIKFQVLDASNFGLTIENKKIIKSSLPSFSTIMIFVIIGAKLDCLKVEIKYQVL
jgi:hypothetical protein